MSTKPKTTTVATGGSEGTRGLSEDFTTVLRNALSGQLNATQTGGGIQGFLGNLFSEGAGNLGDALSERLNTDIERQVDQLRSSFGANFAGSRFGTPGAFAESLFRSEAAPQATLGIGNLQLSALGQLLPSLTALSARGVPQAQESVIASPSTFSQITGALGGLAQGAGMLAGLPIFGGGTQSPSVLTPSGVPSDISQFLPPQLRTPSGFPIGTIF